MSSVLLWLEKIKFPISMTEKKHFFETTKLNSVLRLLKLIYHFSNLFQIC